MTDIIINLPPMSIWKRFSISTFFIKRQLYRSISSVWRMLNKKPLTYNGWIPSKMNDEMYSFYLRLASSYELEHDIVTEKTLKQIIKEKDGVFYD